MTERSTTAVHKDRSSQAANRTNHGISTGSIPQQRPTSTHMDIRHASRRCLIEQCRSNWSVDMISGIFTYTFRKLSGFDLETIPDAHWKYETLQVLAELSRYTACTEKSTTARDEMLVKLENLCKARVLVMPNVGVGGTWDEFEKAFAEDMYVVLNEIKAAHNHGRPSLKRGHQQEKEEITTLEPQSGSKRHKTGYQVKNDSSPVSMGDDTIAAQAECSEDQYAADVASATPHIEPVYQNWGLGSDSVCQQLSENALIMGWKADTGSDQTAIKSLCDLPWIMDGNRERDYVFRTSLDRRGGCFSTTGATSDIDLTYRGLGRMYEVLDATENNSWNYRLAVYVAKSSEDAELNAGNSESTTPEPSRRLSLTSRFLATWGQIPIDVIPDSMRNHFEHGENPGAWNTEAMEQLEQIGREAGVIESATNLHDVRTHLERAYFNRVGDMTSNESHELTVRDTQSVLDEIQRQTSPQQSKSRVDPARGHDVKEALPTRSLSGEPTKTVNSTSSGLKPKTMPAATRQTSAQKCAEQANDHPRASPVVTAADSNETATYSGAPTGSNNRSTKHRKSTHVLTANNPASTGCEQQPDRDGGPPAIDDPLPEGDLEDQIIGVRDGLYEASERRDTLETEVVQAHAQRNQIALGAWHKDFDMSNAVAQVALADAQNRVDRVCQEIGTLERRLAALLRRC